MSFWGSQPPTGGGENKENDAIRALERRIESLESAQKILKLEWEDVFDKMGRMMGRLNARIRKNLANEAAEELPEATLEHPEGPRPLDHVSGSHGLLQQARNRMKG